MTNDEHKNLYTYKNLVIYSGVLAPNATLRSKVVAYGVAVEPAPVVAAVEPAPGPTHDAGKPSRPNYTWAELMRRTFAVDVLECPRCGGLLKLLAAVMSPAGVRAILASLGLPTEAPELRPARAPPEQLDCA